MKRKDESISILSERLRLLELSINNQMVSQYFPSASAQGPPPPPPPPSHAPPCSFWSPHPPSTSTFSQSDSMMTRSDATSAPSVPLPTVSSEPTTSVPAAATACYLCPGMSRNMEILLSEISLLKQQTSSMHENITSICEALQHVTPQSLSSELVPPSLSRNASQSNSTSTRHTQTGPQAQSLRNRSTAKKTPVTVRPIRPLFPPCPWLGGAYPPGPVRHLGPPRPRGRSRSARPSPSISPPREGPPSLLVTEIHDPQANSPPRYNHPIPIDKRSLNY